MGAVEGNWSRMRSRCMPGWLPWRCALNISLHKHTSAWRGMTVSLMTSCLDNMPIIKSTLGILYAALRSNTRLLRYLCHFKGCSSRHLACIRPVVDGGPYHCAMLQLSKSIG